jgi:hypothetical protein
MIDLPADTARSLASAELLRRVGQFRVSRGIVEGAPEGYIAAIAGVGIMRAEPLWEIEAILLTGFCPEFEAIDEGTFPPMYECTITLEEDEAGARTFSRAFTIIPPAGPPEPELPAGMVAVPRHALEFLLQKREVLGSFPASWTLSPEKTQEAIELLRDAAGLV